MKYGFAYSICALIALAGCQTQSAYVPQPPAKADETVLNKEDIVFEPSKGSTLLPLDKGNQWTYHLVMTSTTHNVSDGEPQELEVTYRVTEMKPKNGDVFATMEMSHGDTTDDRQKWLVSKDGMYQLTDSQSDVPYAPAQLVVPFPIKLNGTFDWHGKGIRPDGTTGEVSNFGKVLPIEQVDTAMGAFMAIPIETTSTFGGKTSINTTWFKPGMGIVRFYQSITDPKTDNTKTMILTLRNWQLTQT